MHIRYLILLISFSLALISCDKTKSNQTNSQESALLDDPYCESFKMALNGSFESSWEKGSIIWNGGTNGTVEFTGADFNEMTCEYQVTSCQDGQITMVCNGSVFDTSIDLYTPDSIRLNNLVYTRVK